MKRDLPALTGLRGVAALWVLAFHVWLHLRHDGPASLLAIPARAGYLGVDVFFVLSGFVIALNYADDALFRSPRAYAGFLWRRLARVWPVHFATSTALIFVLVGLFAVGIVPTYTPTASDYWLSLTLVHAWSAPVVKHWNEVSWSVSAEWAAYLVFPAIALAVRRVRRAATAAALVVVAFIALAVCVRALEYATPAAYGMFRVAASFTAGVLLHRIWAMRPTRHARRWDVAAGLALLALVTGAGLFEAFAGKWTALAYFPCLAAPIVLGLACGEGPVTRALSSRPMLYLGRVSFALYLVHGVIFYGAAELAEGALPAEQALLFAAATLASFVLAHVLYTRLEEPARRALVAAVDRSGPRGDPSLDVATAERSAGR